MKKKILAMIAAATLCMGMLPSAVLADAEEPAGETVTTEEDTSMSAMDEETENDNVSFNAEIKNGDAEISGDASEEAAMFIGDLSVINDEADSDMPEGDPGNGIMTLSGTKDDGDPDGDGDVVDETEDPDDLIETYAVLESAVYLDGTAGNDETGDGTDAAPVATFAKAKELAEEYSLDEVYITGTVTVTDTETWDGGLTIYRDTDFTDNNLVIVGDNGNLTLSNITFDDDNVSGPCSLILVNGGGAILTIDDGAVIQNNYNSSNTLSNGDQGAVCVNNGKLVMNAGEIKDNYGHGLASGVGVVANSPDTAEMEFYGGTISGNRAVSGGGIYLAGNSAKLTMYGGTVTGNSAGGYGGGIYVGSGSEAYIYAGTISYNLQTVSTTYGGGGIYVNSAQAVKGVECPPGHLYIYNVEISENKITTTREDYLESYNATIACCETGSVEVNVTDGDVIHDNYEGYTFFVYEMDDSERFILSPIMLGGGAYNWVDAYENPLNLDELTFDHAGFFYATTHVSTSDGNVTGLDRCYTRLIGNEAVVLGSAIGTNGYVTIGKEDGDVSIAITKKWENIPEDDREDIDVYVYAKDGSGVTTCIGTVTLGAENEWMTTIEHLPKYDYDGLEFTYTIAEADGYGWSGTVTGGETYCSGNDYNTDEDKTAGYEYTVTNSLKHPLDIFKYVTEEDGSETGLSGAEFMLECDGMYATFETETDANTGDTYNMICSWVEDMDSSGILTSDADGMIRIEGLDDDTYTIIETKSPEGYEIVDEAIAVTIDGDGNITVSGNTGSKEAVIGHVVNIENIPDEEPAPETVDVNGSKTWDDSDDLDGKRPDSITINLLSNGEITQTVTVTEADGWAWSFIELDKYDSDGNEIAYTITEEAVPDYTISYDGYNVTNSYTPEKVDNPNPENQIPGTGNQTPGTGNQTRGAGNPNNGNPTQTNGGKTGDTGHMGVWLALLITACALAAGGVTVRMRRPRTKRR